MQFLIGTDPEVFLMDKDNNFKSAIDVISGTKEDQIKLEAGGLQHDNVAAEFSCKPAEDEEAFVETMGKMLKSLSSHVHPLKLRVQASAEFPASELQNEESRRFGCDPDYDSWSLTVNQIADGAADSNFRSCGGHIHIGIRNGFPKLLSQDEDGYGRVEIIKSMDFFVGISSILLDTDPTSPARRKLYGKAGAHRPKDYGVEYRAVGNFWISSPQSVRLIYRLTSLAVKAAEEKVSRGYIEAVGEDTVQSIINDSDIKGAQNVFDTFIKPHLKKETLSLFEEVRKASYDVHKEWNL